MIRIENKKKYLLTFPEPCAVCESCVFAWSWLCQVHKGNDWGSTAFPLPCEELREGNPMAFCYFIYLSEILTSSCCEYVEKKKLETWTSWGMLQLKL